MYVCPEAPGHSFRAIDLKFIILVHLGKNGIFFSNFKGQICPFITQKNVENGKKSPKTTKWVILSTAQFFKIID